jgi:AAA domain
VDEKLFKEVEALDDGALIVIEGFSGSGKTSLAQRLSKKLNIQYIDTDCYVQRQSDTDNYVELLDIEHLKEVVGSFVNRKKSVIYVGICAQESLANLGFSPSYRVYVKQLASSGLWHEGLNMDDYTNGQDPSGFYSHQLHKSDMEYHISKQPHQNVDFLHEHVRD